MTTFRRIIGPLGRVLAVATVLLMLGGCATGGYGPGAGYPDQGRYPGQPYPGQPYPDDRYGSSLTATVDGVDPRGQRLILVTQPAYGSRGSRVDVYFDRNTRLFYQGRAVAVEGLERGDVIRVETAQSDGRLWARNIEVVHNVRDGTGGGSQYGNQLRGTVGYMDPRARTIELDSGGYGGAYGSSRTRLRYDDRTVVEYQGRRYRPQDLDRGDLVWVQARQIGGGEWLAERIVVERSARTR